MSDDAAPGFELKSKFWMNIPPMLMDTYLDLVRSLADMDTRASYLITFGDALSMALPKAIEEYKEHSETAKKYPLPYGDPLRKIPHDRYRAWLKMYESIMRKAGIVGGVNTGADDEEDSMDFSEEHEKGTQ